MAIVLPIATSQSMASIPGFTLKHNQKLITTGVTHVGETGEVQTIREVLDEVYSLIGWNIGSR